MPQVPLYSLPTVDPRPTPNVYQNTAGFTSDTFGENVAEAGQRLARTMQESMEQYAAVKEKIRDRDTSAAARDADNQYNEFIRESAYGKIDPTTGKVETPGFMSTEGQSSVDGYAGYLKTLNGRMTELGNGLKDPMAREKFMELAQRRMGAASDDAAQHVARQKKLLVDTSLTSAAQQAGLNASIGWEDPGKLNQQYFTAVSNIKQLLEGKFTPGTPEYTAAFNEQMTKLFYAPVLTSALDSGRGTTFARQYLDAHKDELGAQYQQLSHAVTLQERHDGAMAVQAYVEQNGMSLKDAEAYAREQAGGDKEKEEAFLGSARSGVANHKAQIAEVQDKIRDNVGLFILKNHIGNWSAIPPRMLAGMDAGTETVLRGHVQAIAAQQASEAAAASSRAAQQKFDAIGIDNYQRLQGLAILAPSEFAKLDLSRYSPGLTRDQLQTFLGKQLEVRGQIARGEPVKNDQKRAGEILKARLEQLGIKETDARWGKAFYDIGSKVQQYHGKHPTAMSDKDISDMIDESFVTGTIPGKFWGRNSAYAFEARASGDFQVDNIPAGEKAQVVKFLQSRNLKTDDANVKRYYDAWKLSQDPSRTGITPDEQRLLQQLER